MFTLHVLRNVFVLLVPTEVRPSAIQGLGLFTLKGLRKGQMLWRFVPGVDLQIPEGTVRKLPPAARSFFKTYCALENGVFHLDADNTRFMNHSTEPNVLTSLGTAPMFAARDIKAGEELFCDYTDFDDPARNGVI